MKLNDHTNIMLQPLRVPAGWNVTYNQFYEIDPKSSSSIDDAEQKKDLESYLNEDMFQAVHERTKIVIDLGWYPASNLKSGRFKAVLIKPSKPDLDHMPWHERECDYDWETPLEKLQTTNLAEVVSFLETSMQNTADGKYGLSLSCFIPDAEE